MASSSRRFTVAYSSQPRTSNPPPPGFKYIWEGLIDRYPMELPPLIQNPGSCGFATVARQVELDFIIRHAKYGHHFSPQFDHFECEKMIRATDPGRLFWDPSDLLMRILAEEIDSPHVDERCGLNVAYSGLTHWVSLAYKYPRPNVEFVRHLLLNNRTPLIATVPIVLDYPELSDRPYIGIDLETNTLLPWKCPDQVNKRYWTHTVLLVGVYEAQKKDPYGLLPSRAYYLYQNSFEEGLQDQKEDKSLLGNGMSILDAALVSAICFSINYPQPALVRQAPLPEDPLEVWQMGAYHAFVHEKRRQGMRGLKQWMRNLRTVSRYSPLLMPPHCPRIA